MSQTTLERGAQAPRRPRLKQRYAAEIAPALREEFGYTNVMQIPTLRAAERTV